MRAVVGLEDVRDSAARPGLERLAAERVREPFGRHAHRRPVDREQRDEVARLPANRAPLADDMDVRLADDRVDLRSRA